MNKEPAQDEYVSSIKTTEGEGTKEVKHSRLDLSQFERKPMRLRERISHAIANEEYPANSEIARYLKEKARMDGIIHRKRLCFVLDSSVLIKDRDIDGTIISSFKFAPMGAFKIVFPLQTIEDLLSAKIDKEINACRHNIYTERADLTILPLELQKPERGNFVLAVAYKVASSEECCFLISDEIPMQTRAKFIGIESLDSEKLKTTLSTCSQYWRERWEIDLCKKTENLDWGTLLPFHEYLKMNQKEYLEYISMTEYDPAIIERENKAGEENKSIYDSMSDGTPTIIEEVKNWVSLNFHPKDKWDWFGLIYILFHTGQLGKEYNASKLQKELPLMFPNRIGTTTHLNSAKPMLYTQIISNWEILDEAETVWKKEASIIKKREKNFSKKGAELSFLVIKNLFPPFSKEFKDYLTWE